MKKWQEECYWGKHTQLVPAVNARGYQYRPEASRVPQPVSMPDRVIRAIPTEGQVRDSSMFDKPAPQLWMWFETAGKKKVRFKRIRRREEDEC